MFLTEREISIPKVGSNGKKNSGLLETLAQAVQKDLKRGEMLTRFVVTDSTGDDYRCELGVLDRSQAF